MYLILTMFFLCVVATQSAFATTGSGGNVTNDVSGYRYHIWTNSANATNFTLTEGGNLDILLVAGGGGGSAMVSGGAGGGAVLWVSNATLSAGTFLVVVGLGGAGKAGGVYPSAVGFGESGSNTVFSNSTAWIIAKGGGYSGYWTGGTSTGGAAGGSGGAAGAPHTTSPLPSGGLATTGTVGGTLSAYMYGNYGGSGLYTRAAGESATSAAGGGGAGAPGTNIPGNTAWAGNGANGTNFLSFGPYSNFYWGAGGGGGCYYNTSPCYGGNGGKGGGGGGGVSTGSAGSVPGSGDNSGTNSSVAGSGLNGGSGGANTGGGGGGGGYYGGTVGSGGNGGSGIVIVRYQVSASPWRSGTINWQRSQHAQPANWPSGR